MVEEPIVKLSGPGKIDDFGAGASQNEEAYPSRVDDEERLACGVLTASYPKRAILTGPESFIIGSEASIYFHLPFCRRKCPYCHFFVIPERESDKVLLFNSLLLEWEQVKTQLATREIPSIYFGGGTPTLMGPEAIQKLLNLIPHSPSTEITIEANPEEVTLELMQAFRLSGINRVSLGVQSLDDSLLKTLGRTHNSQKAIEAVHLIHQAGIHNISIDLMYELPNQTIDQFSSTLDQVKKLPITHLSLYNLTIEPNTSYFKRQAELTPLLPNPDDCLGMLDMAVEKLTEMGLKRYEISAFAKEGYHSCHNTGYWTARPFLGLGPSAFSYFNGKRYRNVASLSRYAKALQEGLPPVDFEETLPYPSNLHELLAVELRLLQGVDLNAFEARHGKLPSQTHQQIQELISQGLLNQDHKLKLSLSGQLFYDTVATALI